MSDRKENLDYLAAKHAQEVTRDLTPKEAGDMDNAVTKALGVLQENGLYACALFLKSRPKAEQERAERVLSAMLALLKDLNLGWGEPASHSAADVLQHISRITADELERLLLAKETLEQMLIYARYGAKARKAEGG